MPKPSHPAGYQGLRGLITGLPLLGATCLLLNACGGNAAEGLASIVAQPVLNSVALVPASEKGLSDYFRQALGSSITAPGYSVPTVGSQAATPVAVKALGVSLFAGSEGDRASFTTVQEAGVDEADFIKSDGGLVFSLAGPDGQAGSFDTLRRNRLDPTSPGLKPVDALTPLFSSGIRATGLYLDGNSKQVTVVGQSETTANTYNAWFAPKAWAQGITEIALIDVANPVTMTKTRHLRFTANLLGSRRVGTNLYLVLRSYPNVAGLDPSGSASTMENNKALLDAVSATALLPTLSINGAAPQALVDSSQCFTQPDNALKTADVVTLVALDLASTAPRHTARCFTGSTEAFYMAEQSLYLATTRTAYTLDGPTPVYTNQTNTDIHKFSLNAMAIDYRGSASVQGHLGFDQNRKSFRMGEYQGALRVLTQRTQIMGIGSLPMALTGVAAKNAVSTQAAESPAYLSVLQEGSAGLTVVGSLPNAKRPQALGKPGEQLYASHFLGARGYLVTYRLTDPLYVLDLSDPADPKLAGELQVEGYSDYLFPLSESLLLGVGKDAQSDGTAGDGRFAWYQGVKLSLIDVSDPANPKEAARSIIGRRGTDATVLRDHHGIAMQTVGNRVRISLPVSLYDKAFVGATGAASDDYQFTRTELQKFEVNTALRSLTAQMPLPSSISGERDISADRSLIWNDQVHYYQSGVWNAAAW